LKKRFW